MKYEMTYAQTPENTVERFGSFNGITVTVVKGRTKGQSYTFDVVRGGSEQHFCGCSWGRKNGTTCSHLRDLNAFLAAERAEMNQAPALQLATA